MVPMRVHQQVEATHEPVFDLLMALLTPALLPRREEREFRWFMVPARALADQPCTKDARPMQRRRSDT